VAKLHIDFEWWRDAKGYRLLDAEVPKSQSKHLRQPRSRWEVALGTGVTLPQTLVGPLTLLGTPPLKPQRIVRCGGKLKPYHPLSEFDALFKQFVNDATTPGGALDFVQRFGPLTHDGLDANYGEPVLPVIEHAKAMRRVLDAYSAGRVAQAIGTGVGFGRTELTRIDAALVTDPATKSPRLQLTVRDLLAALWIQLAQAVSSGAAIKQCKQCGELFETGPGTGRRADAEFCSDDHRIAFHSVKRSQRR
jgi:hypothetical protein